MAGAWRRRWRQAPLPALLAWAGSATAGGAAAAAAAAKRNDWAVGVLAGVLLCLALGLAAAWRHLCRLSAGRYHPRPMGRRAVALLRGRWRRLRGRGEEEPGDEEEATAAAVVPREEEEEEEEEEEAMAWSQEAQEEEEEEAGESGPGGGRAAGGSAEALLSDLHAFSGTAAWGDAKPQLTSL